MPFANKVGIPYCVVDFHTEKELYSAKGSRQPTDDLVRVTTDKSLKAPAGTFSIELVGHDWYYKLKSQDLVVIQMGRRPLSLDTKMVGLIDGVYRSRTVGADGVITRTTRVEGRDFCKVLLKAMIQWFPQFADGEFPVSELGGAAAGLLQMIQFYTKHSYQIGSPAILLKNTITNVLFTLMNFQIKYYNSGSLVNATLSDIFRFRLGKTANIIPFMTTMSEFEGALWNYMTSVQNAPFYELFLDTCSDYMTVMPVNKTEADSGGSGNFSATFGEDNAKVVLFLRRTPFDALDWQSLPTHHITLEDDVITEDIGRSDHENYNMFLAKYNMLPMSDAAAEGMIKPLFNAENIRRYGISYLEVPVEGVFGEENISDKVIAAGKDLTATLQRWFSNNITYESGTLQIKGNSKIKIGHRAVHDGLNTVFYVEGLQDEFVNFGAWKTTLTVTRGQTYEGSNTVPTEKKQQPVIPEKAIAEVDASSQTEPVLEDVTYTVAVGDTLWKIAREYYGDGSKYPQITSANPQIKNPDRIYPGQTLIIPNVAKNRR